MSMRNELKLFAGNANKPIAEDIAKFLKTGLAPISLRKFADGEVFVKIEDNVRGADCFVIQPTSPHVNENLMELLIIIDALKRASAGRITAVMPYYGYARQDRKDQPRVPITAKLVADLLTTAGANRVITMDLHVDQIQGFFSIPVDHLYAFPVFQDYLSGIDFDLFVSPDVGGVARTRGIARRMEKEIAIIDKRRSGPNQCEVINVIGNIEGKSLVIYDDILDTGGTIINASRALMDQGAKEVRVICVHGLFSSSPYKKFLESPIKEVAVTNSICQNFPQDSKFRLFNVAPLIGEAIKRIHEDLSVSSLFI